MRRACIVLSAVALVGCEEGSTQHVRPRSAAADCWDTYESRRRAHALGEAFGSAGASLSGQAAPSSRRNENDEATLSARCLMIEHEERASRRERAEEEAAEDRRADAERRALDQRRAELRRHPRAPELRGTAAEASAICAQQTGQETSDASKFSCRIGGVPIFTCTVDDGGRFDRCDTYFEDADVLEFRQAHEERFGPPTAESLSPHGFRVWQWRRGPYVYALSMYGRGVRASTMLDGETGGAASAPPSAGGEPNSEK